MSNQMSGRTRRSSSPPSTATTSSSDQTTSRQVLENVYRVADPSGHSSLARTKESSTSVSSPTTSVSVSNTDSHSTADVPSEVLNEADTGAGAAADSCIRVPSRAGAIHGHLLPTGWTCNYYPNTDEYRFEYQPDDGTGRQSASAGVGDGRLEHTIAAASTQERSFMVRTPTKDDTAKTSRRSTFHLFECQYGYHFPTSPTSSMISELAKQVQKATAPGPTQPTAPKTRQVGYGKHKLTLPTDEDEQTRRLRDMFPTATVPVIEQMIRIYHGREGLIKAALISLGYKRSTEYNVQQASAQSPIMLMMSKPASKKLFDKLVSYFPDKDEALIKNLMYRHKEVEHEIISAIVESSQEHPPLSHYTQAQIDSALRLDSSGTIMKLRYLKFLYPTCEEIELYHLLNCNDLNAQKVMEIVESKGHKRANIEEVIQNRKSQTQQMRAQQAAHSANDKAFSSASDLVQAHVQRTRPTVSDSRVNNLKASLKKTMENLDDGLALKALEATDYNEALARKFLEEMQPVDDSLYMQRYQMHSETKPDVVAFPCKAIQKGGTDFMSIISNENVYIPREVIECDHALALLKVDASTFTGEDFPKIKFTHRQGKQQGLSKGPSSHRLQRISSHQSLRTGPKADLRSGAKYIEVCAHANRSKPNTKALGHKESLVKGRNLSLNCGHNAKLLQRTHPFFSTQVEG